MIIVNDGCPLYFHRTIFDEIVFICRMNEISPAFFQTSLRAIFELLIQNERFGINAGETIEDWSARIQQGLRFSDPTSPLSIFKLSFERLVISFASYLDALGASPCFHWEETHFFTHLKDGRLRTFVEDIRPRFQEAMLLFLGNSHELLQMHRGERFISVICRDLRCASPEHIAVISKAENRLRARCTGPPCTHEAPICTDPAERLPPVAPPQPAAPPAPVIPSSRKVAQVKRKAKEAINGVKHFCRDAIEIILAPEDNAENENQDQNDEQ